ncbi:MAG: undecaprenol kinase [Patescibacteria group bacterium]|nr:undecaprenol kinase [Patescibacteria group bacterium]
MPNFKMVAAVKYDRKKHNISFRNAFNGVVLAYKTQPNFRFHTLFFVLITIASYLYRINMNEYLAIIILSGLVMSMEMVNTAFEAIGDEVSGGEYRKLIGVAKDVAAGAVLVAAFFAITVGVIVFLPRILVLVGIPFFITAN